MSVQRARRLRRSATDADKRLWPRLRNRQIANLKFRRQHPLGNRIVDFYCKEAKLAIELDGSGHLTDSGQTFDLDREIELYEKGIRILRFYNHDISKNLDGVLDAIIYAIDPERSLWPKSQPLCRIVALTSILSHDPLLCPHCRFRLRLSQRERMGEKAAKQQPRAKGRDQL